MAVRMILFEENGVPVDLVDPSQWLKAMKRGQLRRTTWVKVLRVGETTTSDFVAAQEVPELRILFDAVDPQRPEAPQPVPEPKPEIILEKLPPGEGQGAIDPTDQAVERELVGEVRVQTRQVSTGPFSRPLTPTSTPIVPRVTTRGAEAGPSRRSSRSSASLPHHLQSAPGQAPKAEKSRVAAGILALVLGGIGVHKFYLGQVGLGFLYLIFYWTFIPAIVGFIEGLLFLGMSDEEFAMNQLKRKAAARR